MKYINFIEKLKKEAQGVVNNNLDKWGNERQSDSSGFLNYYYQQRILNWQIWLTIGT